MFTVTAVDGYTELFGDMSMCRIKSIRTLGRIMKFGRQRRYSSELPASSQFIDVTDNLGTTHHLHVADSCYCYNLLCSFLKPKVQSCCKM